MTLHLADSELSTPLLDAMEDKREISFSEARGADEPESDVHRDNNAEALHNNQAELTTPFWQNPSQIAAMVSNFSTSYNVVNISLVLPILETMRDTTSEQAAACASSLLAGMILGQLLGGALGDSFLGRLGALRLVMSLQVISSLGSALLMNNHRLFLGLALWRFVLGIGAGGVYPLAAVLSAEQGDSSQPKQDESSPREKVQQLRRVVLTFSTQGVGFLAVPIVTVILLSITDNLDLVWRLILGLGSVPGLVLLVLQTRLYRSDRVSVALSELNECAARDEQCENGTSDSLQPLVVDQIDMDIGNAPDNIVQNEAPASPSVWQSIRKEQNLAQKLLGTAGTWFLFDVLFYGNTLFQPIVLEAAFDGAHDLKKTAIDSLVLSTIALPGYIVSALVMGKRPCYVTQTPRYVQLQGFAAMAILYGIIGTNWSYLKHVPWLLVSIYGATFFFANYGPNTTTFVFPSLMYSPECRSTLNGISAAAGKTGALLGATLFAPVARDLGDDRVMLLCSAVSGVAFAITYCFVRLRNNDQASV